VLERNHFNHYVTPGTINGVPVVFLIDTGATDVSVPAHLADALGLERGRARTYGTANGPAVVFGTRIDRIAIDAIELRDIPASLNPNVAGDEVLLGMSFLKHLEFTQRDRTLVLKPLPERR
jgi:aspartyl protease family protein